MDDLGLLDYIKARRILLFDQLPSFDPSDLLDMEKAPWPDE